MAFQVQNLSEAIRDVDVEDVIMWSDILLPFWANQCISYCIYTPANFSLQLYLHLWARYVMRDRKIKVYERINTTVVTSMQKWWLLIIYNFKLYMRVMTRIFYIDSGNSYVRNISEFSRRFLMPDNISLFFFLHPDTCLSEYANLPAELSSTATRLKDLERDSRCTRGCCRERALTCKRVARSRGDKSKVWNASGRISVYLWRGAIQWYTFPVARNSQYFHQKHTYNSRLRWQTVQPTVLYESSGRIWQRDAPSQLLPFIRALHYSVTESSVTS